jgi:D-alanine-D-alanine ligase
VLVERYVPGRELTVAVMGANGSAKALGVLEIRPNNGVLRLQAKYTDGKAIHLCPAPPPRTRLRARDGDSARSASRLGLAAA